MPDQESRLEEILIEAKRKAAEKIEKEKNAALKDKEAAIEKEENTRIKPSAADPLNTNYSKWDKIEVELGNTFIGLSSNHIESCTLSDYE